MSECSHDSRFSGVFFLPKEDNGCIACALERASNEIKNAYMTGFYNGQSNIIQGSPLDSKFGFEQYQKDPTKQDRLDITYDDGFMGTSNPSD